jgi:hypothetical protein
MCFYFFPIDEIQVTERIHEKCSGEEQIKYQGLCLKESSLRNIARLNILDK